MSAAAPARRLPAPSPKEPRRHLDIAPSRAQRRARPRVYAALVAIAGIGAILLAQLLMSIVLADGAYQIQALQNERRDLVRDQNAAAETLQQLSSTQSLQQNATALGMVPSGNPVFLDVATGQPLGVAGPPRGQIVGLSGNLIGNTLIASGWTMLDPAEIAAAQAAAQAAEGGSSILIDPGATGVAPLEPVNGALPSPTTR